MAAPVHVCIRPPRNARRRLTAASAPMPCRKTDPEITQIFSEVRLSNTDRTRDDSPSPSPAR